MEYKGKNLQFVISPGRFPEDQHREKYLQIYQCWHDVWFETFKELDGISRLHSDAFTRQDLVGAIFVNGECKAMSVYRYADATLPTMSSDSYFENWNDVHRQKLCRDGKNILVCSHFTIHPTARKDILGFRMSDLLMGLTTELIVQSNSNSMTGAMRKNRNAHEVAYDWGAAPVAVDLPSGHGDAKVDLVSFFHDEVNETKRQRDMTPLVDSLWNERIVIGHQPPETIDHFTTSEKTVSKAS